MSESFFSESLSASNSQSNSQLSTAAEAYQSDSWLPPTLSSNAPTEASVPIGEQFLRLQLVPSTPVLLPLHQLVEVLSIPSAQIVPVPHMPAWVMGAYNWRGDILWMVDLGHLCGLTPWYAQATHRSTQSAVLLRVQDRRYAKHPVATVKNKSYLLGLVVDRIGEVEWCDPAVLQQLPPFTVSSQMAQFLQGYWWKSNDDMLAVLDGEAIVAAMPRSTLLS
ncbi:chemotaxis protein CheW [Thermocoleostomius sinensis]|uniref:Chemotaxis protein CheW n=1 Tax=Thermocoleostomius sinensis A174 TaxID=2016057 RepID=A0A9E9CAR6_9CYAN|nr:chemotaxis protein CheW [Thermocoleostomius sinensis]WAL59270.1 chemotaxis protein CheW [Thermocoleostomius sinensis A174]